MIFDASAALAFLQQERGWEVAASALSDGAISAVNLAEVAQKFWRRGIDPAPFIDDLLDLGMRVEPVDQTLALVAADLERVTKPYGLSLADRICLALALRESAPVLTGDRAFASLGLPLDVRLIR